jgi:hypothetical protein
MENFVSHLNDHKEKGHKFFIQGSVHAVANKLIIDKQLVIYLILGTCSLRESWGNLKEKFDIEPIKYILRREVVKAVKETLDNYGAKVYFGDMKGDGNFKMKVDFYPYTKKEDSPADKEEGSVKSGEFKTVTRKPFKPRDGRKTFAKAVKGAKVPAIRSSKATQSEETTKE